MVDGAAGRGAAGRGAAELVPMVLEGTTIVEALAAAMNDQERERPSLLPGWTRGHVVAHLALNADALSNLLTWARTGVETPMYASADTRASDIEAGSVHPAEELLAGLLDADARLRAHLDAMTASEWRHEVRTGLGRIVPAEEVPFLRVRELWIHAVDLDLGFDFADVPPAVADLLLEGAIRDLAARSGTPALEIVADDRRRNWAMGPAAESRGSVTGSTSALLGWLTGRRDRSGLVVVIDEPDALSLPSWL